MRIPTVAILLFSAGSLAAETKAETKACTVSGVAGPARCGTMQVWEDREAAAGRKIGIKFIVLPATGKGPVKEALVFFSGGPGQAATQNAQGIATQMQRVRDGRDLLFVDQRGTGGSHALPCEAARQSDPQSYLTPFYTVPEVTACAKKLAGRADVTQYTSMTAADDLDDLRAALGYEQLDLYGISYGTRAALEYVRRHPDHVRAILMHGAAPNDTRYPLTIPRDAQLAIDGVFADCAKDPGCHAAFPDPAADLAQSLHRFDGGPVRAEVLNPKTGKMTAVTFERDRYGEALRAMMYGAGGSSLIPAVVHRAAQGDFGPAAEEELAWRMGADDLSRGLHLAITCSEDVDFLDLGEAEEIAKSSFMTAFRARDQKAACAVWPHRKLDKSVLDPINSNVPLLIMNGEDDPATARYHAERLLKGFPNGRLVIIPSAGHSPDGLADVQPCYDGLVQEFIRGGDAKTLDTACVAGIHRLPFPLTFPQGKVVAMDSAKLARFAGKYAGSFQVEVVVHQGRLRAKADGGTATLLPTGPMTFRFVESPHTALTFVESKGKVTGFDLAEGGAPVEKFSRSFARQTNQVH